MLLLEELQELRTFLAESGHRRRFCLLPRVPLELQEIFAGRVFLAEIAAVPGWVPRSLAASAGRQPGQPSPRSWLRMRAFNSEHFFARVLMLEALFAMSSAPSVLARGPLPSMP